MKRAKEITGYVAALSALKFFKTVIKRVESHQHHHEVREKFDSSCVKRCEKDNGWFSSGSSFSFLSDHHKGCFNVYKKESKVKKFHDFTLLSK